MRTVRTGKVGDLSLRLVEKDRAFVGLIFAANGSKKAQIEGADADDVWRRLHDEAGRANPKYFGFDGARARFLKFFPNGFHDDRYASEERNYKLKAKAKLDTTAPLEKALTAAGSGDAVFSVFGATNLLASFELMRMKEVLRGPAADDFVQAAARFASGGGKAALLDIERTLKPHDTAKWTVVTYLPFLWRPEAHIFLKPEVTKDFASRVGHRFATDYQARLDYAVYESLLDLVACTAAEIADLRPRDLIDIQSFIWVVGAYEDASDTSNL